MTNEHLVELQLAAPWDRAAHATQRAGALGQTLGLMGWKTSLKIDPQATVVFVELHLRGPCTGESRRVLDDATEELESYVLAYPSYV